MSKGRLEAFSDGVILWMSAMAYYILVRALISHHGKDSVLANAIGNDFKGRVSLVIYSAAIVFAFVNSGISLALYIFVAIMWLTPDTRIEKNL